jgi:hypothetical protein
VLEDECGLWAAMEEKVWGLLGCWEEPEDGVGEGSDDGGVVMLAIRGGEVDQRTIMEHSRDGEYACAQRAVMCPWRWMRREWVVLGEVCAVSAAHGRLSRVSCARRCG